MMKKINKGNIQFLIALFATGVVSYFYLSSDLKNMGIAFSIATAFIFSFATVQYFMLKRKDQVVFKHPFPDSAPPKVTTSANPLRSGVGVGTSPTKKTSKKQNKALNVEIHRAKGASQGPSRNNVSRNKPIQRTPVAKISELVEKEEFKDDIRETIISTEKEDDFYDI